MDTEKIQYSSTGGKVQKIITGKSVFPNFSYMTHHHKSSGFPMKTRN